MRELEELLRLVLWLLLMVSIWAMPFVIIALIFKMVWSW